MAASIGFDLFARDHASAAFDRVGRSAEGSSRKVQLLAKVGKAAFLGVAGGLTLAVGAGVKFAQAAADDEESARRMALQFHNSANATVGQVAATERWISKMGLARGVADDELRPVLARLVVATGSVTRAQQLASLAMDVSAGTGKDLQAVSTALAKAQNGSVGGLARLGVATKDAAGKTKTFAAIQKDLAKQFKGASASAADTAGGKMKRLSVAFHEAEEAAGYALLPAVTNLADFLVKRAIPAMGQAGDWASTHLGPPMQQVGDLVEGDVVPAFKQLLPVLASTASAIGEVSDFVSNLPGPVKSLGLEVGIAAIVFPRLAAGVTAAGSSMITAGAAATSYALKLTSAEARSAGLAATSARMGAAMKSAAGIGGMALLIDGAGKAQTKIGALETVAGGAALGFSMGGPWGAAIGGAAGGLYALQKASDASADAVWRGFHANQDYIGSLDQLSAKVTKKTRQTAAKNAANDGTFDAARLYGIPDRDTIGAITGNVAALERIKERLRKAVQSGFANKANAKDFLSSLGLSAGDVSGRQAKLQSLIRAAQTWKEALKGVPKDVRTTLRNENYQPTIAQLKSLKKQGELNPKQLTTVVKATGIDLTKKQAKELGINLKDIGKVKPDFSTLNNGTKTGLAKVKGTATTGGNGVGGALKQGIIAGFAGTQAQLSAQAGAAVRAAIAAARHAADAHSPSRKMEQLGKDLGEGARKGLHGKTTVLTAAGAGLVTSLVAGINSKKAKFKDAFDAIKSYADSTASALQDALGERDSFAAGFAGFGTSVFSDDFGDTPITVANILSAQQSKAAQAASLNDDIQSLLGKGVSADVLQQIQSSGASGIKQIHALAGADSGSIAQFNSLSAQTAGYYNTAGMAAGNAIYGANVANKAQADVNAQSLVTALQNAGLGGGDNVTIQLEGQTIVAAVAKSKKKRGQK